MSDNRTLSSYNIIVLCIIYTLLSHIFRIYIMEQLEQKKKQIGISFVLLILGTSTNHFIV